MKSVGVASFIGGRAISPESTRTREVDGALLNAASNQRKARSARPFRAAGREELAPVSRRRQGNPAVLSPSEERGRERAEEASDH